MRSQQETLKRKKKKKNKVKKKDHGNCSRSVFPVLERINFRHQWNDGVFSSYADENYEKGILLCRLDERAFFMHKPGRLGPATGFFGKASPCSHGSGNMFPGPYGVHGPSLPALERPGRKRKRGWCFRMAQRGPLRFVLLLLGGAAGIWGFQAGCGGLVSTASGP